MSKINSDAKDFAHLHLHTEYSLLDGAIRIKDLPDRLKELEMHSCAVTDHGVMYGAVDFYRTMTDAGLHPVIGCECYVAPRSRTEKEGNADRDPSHLILLAKDSIGLKNLNYMVSSGFTEGFYYRPRIDHQLLEERSEGLICLSACLGGELSGFLMGDQYDEALERAIWYDKIFGRNNYFLEIQSNSIPAQAKVNQYLIRMAEETGIPLVATNDCHYLKKEDASAHEILVCMQTGKRISDENRMKMPTDDFYIKSKEEVQAFFPHVQKALENTVKIAERCDAGYTFGKIYLPVFNIPEEYSDHTAYMRDLAEQGLERRFAISAPENKAEYMSRLDYEIDVISSMGYTDYYLIVWDFIRYAREHHIMVGPGRGSGAGSVVAYALSITNIDPIRYGLLFERFLNSERVSMPDFDIDFCYERRQEVIDYVTEKYGAEKVAQVITFGTLAAKACVRDVARVLELPYAESDRLAKMIPNALGMTLEKALDLSPELKAIYEERPEIKNIIDTALLLEGMPRHASTHAAGVVISGMPLTDLVPLSKNDESVVVQFDKNNVESIGLLKFDFLGLRTLTVMRDTAAMVLKSKGIELDFDRIPLDEKPIYEMISRGDTGGVFQLESSGMTSFMTELQPESLEDIIAGISLYRPGPMEQIPRYVESKHDPSKVKYSHPLLEPILKVTYGCMVYQEQVMQIVRDLAGFSMGQSDNIRRAMSKKKASLMEAYRKTFIYGGEDELGRTVEGAVKRGVSEKIAEEIFNDVTHFAGYAFNKSHAAAYAVVGYFTAYLKYHYPAEFMTAILNSHRGDLPKCAVYIRQARKMGLQLLPPDVNRSYELFSVENETSIRFGLSAVKNVGLVAIGIMVEERKNKGEFKSCGDFFRRMFSVNVNKKMIESLIRASALDCFGIPRSHMVAVLDPFFQQLQSAGRNMMEGQISLFALTGEKEDSTLAEPEFPDVPEFSQEDILAGEKEMIGLYISGHPLDAYQEIISKSTNMDSSAFLVEANELIRLDRKSVLMAGLLMKKNLKTTKNGGMMAFLQVEDLSGQYEVIVFPQTLQSISLQLQENAVLLIGGRLSIREDEEPKLIAERVSILQKDGESSHDEDTEDNENTNDNGKIPPILESVTNVEDNSIAGDESRHEAKADLPLRLHLRYHGEKNDMQYKKILATLEYFHGTVPVVMYFSKTKKREFLPPRLFVEISSDTMKILANLCGTENMVLS